MPFRFGFLCTSTNVGDVLDCARRAEAADFDIFQVGDHVGSWSSPLVALAAAAAVTERIRVGTLVLNNDLRHPVVLGQELSTLDHLSNGRLEVGIGAGHSFPEYSALGIPFDSPRVRKERMAESVEILRSLFDGHSISRPGRHYVLDDAEIASPKQPHLPILVGVNGRRALTHAARYADFVAPTMVGRTLADGQNHEVRWEAPRLDDTVSWIRATAGARAHSGFLHALVQAVVVTDSRDRAAADIAARLAMDVGDALATPYLCIGTHDEMVDHLLACRQRWGIDYYTVRSLEEFEPVVRRLRRLDEEDVPGPAHKTV